MTDGIGVLLCSLLSEDQHGFSKGKSCMSNLLITLEDVTESLDEGFGMDIFYLDYSKAFDMVPHKCLISKLKAYGITGNNQIRSGIS